MRLISCSLLCASLLFHAVLGCCWHDLHEQVACASMAAADTDSCHDHDGTADGHSPHAPCKGHPNCHGLCHYLPVQKSSIGKCLDQVVIDIAVDAHATTGSHFSALSQACGACEYSSSPPVRLHLFHQILLI